MNFSEIVKARMDELGIRPIALARKTGYSPQYIGELLAGRKRWNETIMVKVCEALGIQMEFIPRDEAAALDAS